MKTTEQKKIGIMGGTFDPIHIGHLIMAQSACESFALDRVLFIPSGHSYFKDHRAMQVTAAERRLAMTRLAIAGNPRFVLSDIEVRRAGNTYTFETLEELRAADPQAAYYFIAGADSVAAMRLWRCPERFFAACTVLAAVRSETTSSAALAAEIEALRRDFGADIRLLSAPDIAISSTALRETAARGGSLRYLTPEPVRAYIEKEGLYRTETVVGEAKQR